MITIFRKEMRKWNIILWLIAASLVIGMASMFFVKAPGKGGAYQVGSVNGSSIYMDEFRQSFAEVKAQIDMIKNYARAQGISEEWFLAVARLSDPQEIAFQEVVENKVLDKMVNKFVKGLDQKYLLDSIAKSIPAQFISNGKINERAYREHLRHVGLTISEFESKKEEDIKRNLFKAFLKEAFYTPKFSLREQYIQDHSQKSFNVLEIPFTKFLEKAKSQKVSDEVLNKFYQEKKENYAIPEKRQAEYWVINPAEYEKKLVINDNTINTFYENHKSEMFRIAPEIKVRKILITGDKVKAEKIYNEVNQNKDKFADFAKKYSEDKSTSASGGLVNFFKSGTYDKDFEKAAFRLQNKGEISPLVQTKNGFEIILLEERKAAQYKPLESVKGEVIKALKSKKLDFVIKGDLETLMQNLKQNPEALDLFAKEKGLKSLKTDFLSAENGQGNSIDAVIAQKMFDKNKIEKSKGYFESNKNFILFREIAKRDRAILSFNVLKNVLEQDFYNIDARRKLAEFATKSQADILAGKTTLTALQKELNLKLTNSGLLTKEASSKNPDFASLKASAFNLSNKNQALIIEKGKDLCIIQLESFISPKAEEVQREVEKMQNSENDRNKALFVNSFIASLLRNAKIEKNEEMLSNIR